MSQKLDITIPGFTIIAGICGSGKTSAIEYILYKNKKKFDYGLIFTNTFFTDNSFSYIPNQYVHGEFSEEKLSNFMDIQSNLVKQGVKKNAFLVLDDCLDDPGMWNSSVFKRLISQFRHYNITIIITTQYPQAIPARFRSGAFQILIFQNTTERAIRGLFESFGQLFNLYNEFKNFVNQSTVNYQFIFINNKCPENSIEKKYQVMRINNKFPKNWKLEFNTNI